MSIRVYLALKCFSTISFILVLSRGFSQTAHDFMVSGGFDLIKTDNSGVFEKVQTGIEFNYFITEKFTATAGLELWSGDDVSLVFGGRWLPLDNIFVRARGLIGENDFSIGAGWVKHLHENWRFEATSDFYFETEFAIRVGVAYLIRKRLNLNH